MYGKFSFMLINYINSVLPGKDSIELEEIKYGLDIIISFFIKIVLIFFIGFILGVTPYLIAAVVSLASIKPFAGGVHAKNDLQCFILSSVIIFSIIYLSLFLNITIIYKIIIYVYSFIMLIINAPADTEEKPYVNKNLRKRLKVLSCFVSVIMFAAAVLLEGVVGNIIILSLFMSSLFTTPTVYKLMGRRYRNYENYKVFE